MALEHEYVCMYEYVCLARSLAWNTTLQQVRLNVMLLEKNKKQHDHQHMPRSLLSLFAEALVCFRSICASLTRASAPVLQKLLRLPNSPLHLADNVLQSSHAALVLLRLETLSGHALLEQMLRLLRLGLREAFLR